MTRFSETAQSVPCTGAQSRVVYMDPQLATEESICDLSTKIRCSSVGIFARFGPTHDCVLDEELFLEIVANLLSGHDEVDDRLMGRVGTIFNLSHQERAEPAKRVCNRRKLENIATIGGTEMKLRRNTGAPWGRSNVRLLNASW